MSGEDVLSLGCIVAFMLVAAVWSSARRPLLLQARTFFYTPRNPQSPLAKTLAFHGWETLLMTLLLAIEGTLFYYIVSESPGRLLPCMGILVAYFLAKHLLAWIANSVFFTLPQHRSWVHASYFVIALEGLVLFPWLLLCVYQPSCRDALLPVCASIVILGKTLLAVKAWIVFFGHIHCLTQYLLYLCTLEIAPLFGLLTIGKQW